MRKIVLLAVWAALLSACASSRAGGRGAAEEVMRMLESAEREGNVPLIVSLFTTDAVVLLPRAATVSGAAEVAESYRTLFREQKLEISFTVEEAEVGRGAAWARGVRVGYLVARDGVGEIEIRDRYLAVLRLEDGEWRIARLAWSPEPAVIP